MNSLNYSENTKVVSRGVLSTRMKDKPLETGEIFFNYKQSNSGKLPYEKNPYEIWIGSVDPDKPIRIGAQGFITIAGNFSSYFSTSLNLDTATKEEFEKTATLPTEGSEGLKVGNVYFIDTDIYIPKTSSTPELNGGDLAIYLGNNTWWRVNNNISSASSMEYTFNSGRPTSLEESEYNQLDSASVSVKASLDNLYTTKAGLDSKGKLFYDQIPDEIKENKSDIDGPFQVHHENSYNSHNTLTVNPECVTFEDNISKSDSYKIEPHHVDIKGDLDIRDFKSTLAFGKINDDSTSNSAFGFGNKIFGFPFNYAKDGYGTKDLSFGNLSIDNNLSIGKDTIIKGALSVDTLKFSNSQVYDDGTSDTLNVKGSTGKSTTLKLIGGDSSSSLSYDGQKLSINSPTYFSDLVDITKSTTIGSDLSVSGNSTLSGSLLVGGNATLNSSLSVAKFISSVSDITSSEGMISGALSNIIEKYTLDLSSLSTDTFYPVTFSQGPEIIDCEIHSQGNVGSAAYNQNEIHFELVAYGWSDTPVRLSVLEYGCYDNNEITIGCIGYSVNASEQAIWLRGGLSYSVNCNVKPTLHSSSYTVLANSTSSATFSIGSNSFGGTNSSVNILWSPTSGYSTFLQSTSIDGNLYVSGGTETKTIYSSRIKLDSGSVSSTDTASISIVGTSGGIRLGADNKIQSYDSSNNPSSISISSEGGDTFISLGGGNTYFGSGKYNISSSGAEYSGTAAYANVAHAFDGKISNFGNSGTYIDTDILNSIDGSQSYVLVSKLSNYIGNVQEKFGFEGTIFMNRGNAGAYNITSKSSMVLVAAYNGYSASQHAIGTNYYTMCQLVYNGSWYLALTTSCATHFIKFKGYYFGNFSGEIVSPSSVSSVSTLDTGSVINDNSNNIYALFNIMHPIGEVYVQYPGSAAPAALYGYGTWTQISFNGAFFRSSGGAATSFGSYQAESLPNIYGTFVLNTEDNEVYTNPTGCFYSIGATGNGSDGSNGSFRTIAFDASHTSLGIYGGSTHVTPYNVTVLIWKRTA